jgi:hypothetical protein
MGSILLSMSTIIARVICRSGRIGRRFKSCHPDHFQIVCTDHSNFSITRGKG